MYTLNTNGAAPINFLTNNTERVRIDPTGLVGVGTTTPFAKISIQANNNEQTELYLQSLLQPPTQRPLSSRLVTQVRSHNWAELLQHLAMV